MTGIINPALFGMPDATTAGVQAGVTLTNYTGPMTITTAGAVIENKIINGTLTIAADNVTIKNCVIQNFDNWGILSDNADNTRVEYCDIDGSGSTRTSGLGIGGGTNSAIIGCDIKGMVIGIQLFGRAEVKDNYIHDLADTSSNPDDRHFDGITLFGGQNGSVIEHNTISMPTGAGGTAAVFIKTEFGAIDGVQVRNNLMSGDPSFTLYVESTTHPITNVTVENNYVDRGIYGYFNVVNSTPIIRNNVQWNNNTDATPYPTSAPPPPSTPTAPSAPTIASFSNDTGVAGDGITNDNTLQLKGTAAANSTIKIYDGSTQIGTTTATSTGSWDYITSVLTNAKHVLTATATNSSGQTSAASGAVTVTVDTVAPTAPVLSSNSIVNTNQIRLSGTAEANSTVTVYDGTTVVGTGTANSTGAWSITSNALSTGTHTLTTKAADAAGNISAASQSVSSVISGTPAQATTIETAGVTSLVQNGNSYYLNSSSGGNGPILKIAGVSWVADQTGWKAIGAEQTANGYLIAWKFASEDQYSVWNTDKNGNYISHAIGVVSGNSSTLTSFETSFQQDFNGDGTVGSITKTIESAGSTSLAQVGDSYQLNSSGGTNLVLKMDGTAWVADKTGWAAIGVEQTANGYLVAWKFAGQDKYSVWNTDKNGNYVSHAIGVVSG
ncbi:right-handed parallel beta-helix repeat-containing protein, partial [Bradyrhizobium sp. WSM 1738]|uniref:Ig-like domain-containing protein n=1 Tax=Bradyrhizobium hereditatis TaxID=2821405 RepID=UPI001CE3928A